MWKSFTKPLGLLASFAALAAPVLADDGQILKSSSLNTCQDNSGFTASLFNVAFTPGNSSASVNLIAISSIQGMVKFDVAISVYGYEFIRTTVDPCTSDLAGLCPMTSGKIPMNFNLKLSEDAVSQIPGIAYTIPDLDAKVRVFINMTDGTDAGKSVACVEADVSNGKTVDLLGVKWATAIVAGLSLASSAVVSGLGHSNAAAHVAANALSLFGYFQAQAMIGLTGVPLPPIVQSWTQDFQWSMGIIKVTFMQDIFTWYQRATGGTPSTVLDSLTTVSVQVEKRSMDLAASALNLAKRSVAMMPRAIVEPLAELTKRDLMKRGNIQTGSGSFIVFGIQRVAYRAYIESTNLFMTGLTFFCLFVLFTVMGVAAFKGFCELAVKNGWMKSDKFVEFRHGWFTVLKGILFRLTLIGFPQMVILCLWEFTQNDSAAEMVLAVFFFFGMSITLGWAASKVIRIARRSVAMHRNPAYILFSDPQALNKWGFLYVQFRASAYYFIVPVLGYTVVKGMLVAFAQKSGIAQAVGFIIVEAAALITASVLRPWMDKSTNSFNIAICVINFLNAIFLLIFTDVFNQPPLVTGAVGVVLWVANAAFSLVLLIMLIVTTLVVFFRENPDARYQQMDDDRVSFMKSQTQLTTTTELDALAATARGDKAGYKHGMDLDDDADSISSDSLRRQKEAAHAAVPPSATGSPKSYAQPPRSPVDPSMPLFPAGNNGAQGGYYNNNNNGYLGSQPSGNMRPISPYGQPRPASPYGQQRPASPYGQQRPVSPYGQPQQRPISPYGGSQTSGYRNQQNASPVATRSQNNASPWQRGAGYEH
ncbi:TRP-domain-containing protein [Thozetella sp. PMI_491]|nr:TRP-domain-containing protein [Thozetella sp. PMI_491]